MPSFQNAAPAPNKFKDALDIFTPFHAQPGDEPVEEDPTPLTKEFDTRLRLGESLSAKTGSRQQQQHQQQYSHQSQSASTTPNIPPENRNSSDNDGGKSEYISEDISSSRKDDCSESDDEFDYLLDDDDEEAVLQAIRQKRLRQLVKAQSIEAEHRAKGHGEVRTISQDEFLTECTSNKFVVVHFFHRDFELCKIMDHHLKIIATNPQHLACKFVRIDAEKAPFFVVKLKIKILPSLIVFKDGQTIERLLGFEGLVESPGSRRASDIDDFPTCRLGYWLESAGAIEYDEPESDDDDGDIDSRKRFNKINITRI